MENKEELPHQVTYNDRLDGNKQKASAAFRWKSDYRLFIERCQGAGPKQVIDSLIKEAQKNHQYMTLSGTEEEYIEASGELPWDELIKALEEGLERAKMLKSHKCHWVTNGETSASYCDICGMSGDI